MASSFVYSYLSPGPHLSPAGQVQVCLRHHLRIPGPWASTSSSFVASSRRPHGTVLPHGAHVSLNKVYPRHESRISRETASKGYLARALCSPCLRRVGVVPSTTHPRNRGCYCPRETDPCQGRLLRLFLLLVLTSVLLSPVVTWL